MAETASGRIAAAPGTRVQVTGVALKTEKAPGLARQRAALVRAYLLSRGLDPRAVVIGRATATGSQRETTVTLLPPGQ